MRIYHTPSGRKEPHNLRALEISYIKLTPEEVEVQKRFGFTSDNIKVRATFATTFTDHGARRRAE
jgi:hypothetical protein